MSSFSKIVLVALTALAGTAASAHTGAVDHAGFQPRSVIASHEAALALSAVVHHPRHRHHRNRGAHPVRHVR